MAFTYLLMALVLVAGLVHRSKRSISNTFPVAEPAAKIQIVAPIICAIVASFAAYMITVREAAVSQIPFPAWYSRMPLISIDDIAPYLQHTNLEVTTAFQVLMAVNMLLLIALYRSLHEKIVEKPIKRLMWIGFAAMSTIALSTNGLESQDMYAYIGSGLLGTEAYRPPALAFGNEFKVINYIYGVPIFPDVYGPIWLIYSKFLVSIRANLAFDLLLFRLSGCASLILAATAMRRLRVGWPILGLFIINPILIDQYVLNGHNDILPLVLILWAFVLRKNTLAAILLVAIAGSMKLPYLAISVLAFAQEESTVKRIAKATVSCILGICITIAVTGGTQYLEALKYSSGIFKNNLPLALNMFHYAIVALCLASLVAAIIWKAKWKGAPWLFVSLSFVMFPWYMAWGLPYAIYDRRWIAAYLCTMPIANLIIPNVYTENVVYQTIMLGIFIGLLLFIVTSWKSRRNLASS